MFCWHPAKEELNHSVESKESFDTIFREAAQDHVEAMDKEVAGLREIFTRTSQEAKEKLQQEKPAVSGSGMSHK